MSVNYKKKKKKHDKIVLLGKDNRNTIQVLPSKACFSKQCIKRIS